MWWWKTGSYPRSRAASAARSTPSTSARQRLSSSASSAPAPGFAIRSGPPASHSTGRALARARGVEEIERLVEPLVVVLAAERHRHEAADELQIAEVLTQRVHVAEIAGRPEVRARVARRGDLLQHPQRIRHRELRTDGHLERPVTQRGARDLHLPLHRVSRSALLTRRDAVSRSNLRLALSRSNVKVAFACVAALALLGIGGAAERPSVVTVRVWTAAGVPERATGTVVEDGRVLTVDHVLAGARRIEVDGRPATVVRRRPGMDLAVLRVPGVRGPRVRFGEARAGDEVRVLARPAVVRRRVRARLVDAPGRPRRPSLELGVIVASGDSGAPVVDGLGRVVGVIFARSTRRGGTAYAVRP